MNPPTITYLTNIWFGAGVVRELPEIAASLNIRKPLVVTDRGVVAAGLVERVCGRGAIVFDAVNANPDENAVRAGVAFYREQGCDGVITIGGGSPIDCAKSIALMVTHAEPLRQYAFIEGGLAKITGDKPPVIVVPTTAGTGSEVGRGSMITFNDGAKLGIVSPKMIPQAAVCDPELTVGMPAWLTAASGMDAVSHCVETFCSPKFNPVAEAIAIDGLGRACRNILRAVDTPGDIGARSEMLMASMMGALTFQRGLGAVHAIAHPLGGLPARKEATNGWAHGLHHGTINSILLPHVLRFNSEAAAEKMERMAHLVGCGSGRNLPFYFENLARAMRLPGRLRDLGLSMEECLSVVDGALRDYCGLTNPRKLGREEVEGLLRGSW